MKQNRNRNSKTSPLFLLKIYYYKFLNSIFFKILKICFTAFVKILCEENSPGYIYNETVSVCYKIDSNPRLLAEAELFCGESGGHLLRIDTEIKQKLVENIDLQSISTKIYQIDNPFLHNFYSCGFRKFARNISVI